MAELDTSGGGKHKKGGKVRGKKMSTRVDMTPMVDLGFLLITFFILTTSFNTPQAMEINMPDKTDIPEEEQIILKESCSMTIVLGERDKIYWWMGMNDPANGKIPQVNVADYSAEGIRSVLLKQGAEVQRKSACSPNGMNVLIKPMIKSKYKNMVDILDEMKITRTMRYALVDISDDDLILVANK